MSTLTARDLMTPDVVTVPPETPVIAVARLLAERGISAVPVLDKAGTVLGVVTEADLIRRLAENGGTPWYTSAAEFIRFRAANEAGFAPLIRASGARVE